MESRTRDGFIAWAGLGVAFIAILIAAYTARETRQHNRYLATPFVLPYVTNAPEDETWGIFLRNVGVGPAKINYRAVLLDGKPIDMKTLIRHMGQEGALSPETASYQGLKQGSYLGVGETKLLLTVPRGSPPNVEKFGAFIHQRIDIRLDACSVYDECKPINTKES